MGAQTRLPALPTTWAGFTAGGRVRPAAAVPPSFTSGRAPGNDHMNQQVFAAAIEEFGKVDILVNNAGFGDMAPIEEATDEHFEKVMAINLFGVFRYCRQAVRQVMPRGNGVIVNVSSVNGDKPVLGVAYTTSKAAVSTMTKNIAIRFSGTGIRCNALAPGQTETDMDAARERGDLTGGTRDVGVRGEVREPDRPQYQASRPGLRRPVPGKRHGSVGQRPRTAGRQRRMAVTASDSLDRTMRDEQVPHGTK